MGFDVLLNDTQFLHPFQALLPQLVRPVIVHAQILLSDLAGRLQGPVRGRECQVPKEGRVRCGF